MVCRWKEEHEKTQESLESITQTLKVKENDLNTIKQSYHQNVITCVVLQILTAPSYDALSANYFREKEDLNAELEKERSKSGAANKELSTLKTEVESLKYKLVDLPELQKEVENLRAQNEDLNQKARNNILKWQIEIEM